MTVKFFFFLFLSGCHAGQWLFIPDASAATGACCLIPQILLEFVFLLNMKITCAVAYFYISARSMHESERSFLLFQLRDMKEY